MQRVATIIGLCLCIFACADDKQIQIPLYQVAESTFFIEVEGFGEIEAAQAQRIMTPGRRPMTIAWLQDENTYVEQGEIIARFDASQIVRDSREEELELLRLQQDIVQSVAEQNQASGDVDSDQTFVAYEYDFTERFAIDDLRIYSQLEIIDTLANKDFLEAKDEFLDWKASSIGEQHDNQMAVLDIRKQSVETKFKQHQQALSSLEVVSPYTGLLVYEKDRRGEKPAIGQTVFPGRPIAQIPNLDDMQAKVFVQANDAIDLDEGQAVTIGLDAFPDLSFKGEVKSVSGFPRSIERGNPVTYFELVVTLLDQDRQSMQPGRKLSAKIHVKPTSKRRLVPLQSLHFEDGATYVYVRNSGSFVRTPIVSGQKNQYLVEVLEGLKVGDEVALSIPPDYLILEAS